MVNLFSWHVYYVYFFGGRIDQKLNNIDQFSFDDFSSMISI